jgi:hypothetical protein
MLAGNGLSFVKNKKRRSRNVQQFFFVKGRENDAARWRRQPCGHCDLRRLAINGGS